jgi:hypothetical protein
MKKPYQIDSQRAVKRLEELAAEGNPAVQLVLPMAEALGWLKQGVGELIRQAGVQIIGLVMEEEVRELVGERSQPQAERKANRWGSERGYCVVMGQKLPIERPRVRSTEDREVRLGSYELFHRGEPLTETVWEKLMLGLSTRKYGQAVRQFSEAYGLEKSAVSEHFIEASRVKLKQLMERRLDKMRFCALLIDATPFEGQQMVAALGIGQDGRKTILGIRQGATENATVVGELLGDLAERGLDFTATRLYVLDGGKALSAAVKTHAGDSALIQRCQVHKTSQRAGSLAGGSEAASGAEAERSLRDGQLRGGQVGPEQIAPGIDGLQSKRSTELGRRDGRNAHGAQATDPAPTAPDSGLHQRDRVGLLRGGEGLRQRQTLASRRSARALGGLRPAGCRETIPPRERP